MKAFLLTMIAVASVSTAARAEEAGTVPQIANLSCVAANGVELKSTSTATERGIVLATTWGAVKKEFEAYVSPESKKNTLYINLDVKKATTYQLVLNADATLVGNTQKVTGVIMQPKALGALPRLVTFVKCEVSLR